MQKHNARKAVEEVAVSAALSFISCTQNKKKTPVLFRPFHLKLVEFSAQLSGEFSTGFPLIKWMPGGAKV